MWLGMLAAALGQIPWIPVEPLTWLAGLLAGYIAQVAHWFAAPGLGAGRARSRRGWRRSPLIYVTLGAGAGARAALVAATPAPRRAPRGAAGARSPRRLPQRRRSPGDSGRSPSPSPSPSGDATPPGCGSTSSTSARATRSCCEPAGRRRSWSTPGRPTPTSPGELERRGIDRLAALLDHPSRLRPHRRRARASSGEIDVEHLLAARRRPLGARRGARGLDPIERVAAGSRLRAGDAAPRRPLAAARSASAPARR